MKSKLIFVAITLFSFTCSVSSGFEANKKATGQNTIIHPEFQKDAHIISNEIIVKFCDPLAQDLEDLKEQGEKALLKHLPQSLRQLNQRYHVSSFRQLCPHFAKSREHIQSILRADPSALTKKDKRLVERLQRAPKGKRIPNLQGIYKLRYQNPFGEPLQVILDSYRSDPHVEYASPNYAYSIHLTPNDPHFGTQWSLHNTGQMYSYSGSYNTPPGTPDSDIDAPEAWDVETGGEEIVIAVIDTGVDYNHRDLSANIWVNQAEQSGSPGIDDDGNGYIDDIYGYDFLSHGQDPDSDPIDESGHGTHCAGIIAAVGNNSTDITGVSWNSKIMSIKFIDPDGNGWAADSIEAIYYAVDNGADVISLSWGGGGQWGEEALEESIAYAVSQGAVVLASAGNDNYDYLIYPGRFYDVLNVGATDSNDEKASFSNYCCWVEVAAPGVDILSLRADATSKGIVQNYYETVMSGTSMSCPHAAGIAALILSHHPEFTTEEVHSILKMTSDPIITPEYIGQGRINAAQALTVDSPPIIAFLDMEGLLAEQTRIGGMIDINGTAKGADFTSYTLYYGEGSNPSIWSEIYTGATPVDDGVLLANFNLARFWQGLYTIRLVVSDIHGRYVEELRYIRVYCFRSTGPFDTDILKPGSELELHGIMDCENTTLQSIEYGLGYNPTEWFSDNLTLDSNPNDDVFGLWDTSFITENNFYTLRFTFTSPWGTREGFTRSIYFDTRLKDGWPQYISRESSSYRPETFVTPADLDNDGYIELVTVEEGAHYGDKEPILRVFNYDGTQRWSKILDRYPMEPNVVSAPYNSVPVIGDIDRDGYMEIFVDVGKFEDSATLLFPMYAFNHDGSILDGNWPLDLPSGNSEKLLADVNFDGIMELVVRTREGTAYVPGILWPNLVYIIDRWGTVLHTIYVPSTGRWFQERIPMAVGNFDNDSDLEIATQYGVRDVAGLPDKELPAIYNIDGTLVPGWPVESESCGVYSFVTGDLDQDGLDELLVTQAKEPETGLGGGVFVYDASGNVMPGWPVLTDEIDKDDHSHCGIALSDIDNDGDLEICVTVDAGIYLYDHYGNLLSGWPQFNNSWSSFNSPPVIGDITGDSLVDCIAKAGALQPSGLKYNSWDSSGGVWAWNQNGTRIDLCPENPALKPIWMELWYRGRVSIADIDNDGKVDIIGTSYNNRGLGDYTTVKGRDSIYVWELDAPYDDNNMDWPMWQHDSRLTGHYGSLPELTSVKIQWDLFE